jgi:hypothetical protein
MHLEAIIDPGGDALGSHDRASLDKHLEGKIE